MIRRTVWLWLLPLLLLVTSSVRAQFFELHDDGTYDFNYHTSNDLHRSEVRYADGTVLGKYAYRDPAGDKVEVRYSAGRHGYRESRKVNGAKSPVRDKGNVVSQQQQPVPQSLSSYSKAGARRRQTTGFIGYPVRLPATEAPTTLAPSARMVNYHSENQMMEPASSAPTETTTSATTTTTTTTEELLLSPAYEFLPLNATMFGAIQLPIAFVAVEDMGLTGHVWRQKAAEAETQQTPTATEAPTTTTTEPTTQVTTQATTPTTSQQPTETQPRTVGAYWGNVDDVTPLAVEEPHTGVERQPILKGWVYMRPSKEREKLEEPLQDILSPGFVPIPMPHATPPPELMAQDDEDGELDAISYFVPPAPRGTPPPPATSPPEHGSPPPPPPPPINHVFRVPIAGNFKDWRIPYPVVAQKRVLSWG